MTPNFIELQKRGGDWLGVTREYIQRKAKNGETVIWGSTEQVSLPEVLIEEMASMVAASAIKEYNDRYIRLLERFNILMCKNCDLNNKDFGFMMNMLHRDVTKELYGDN